MTSLSGSTASVDNGDWRPFPDHDESETLALCRSAATDLLSPAELPRCSKHSIDVTIIDGHKSTQDTGNKTKTETEMKIDTLLHSWPLGQSPRNPDHCSNGAAKFR